MQGHQAKLVAKARKKQSDAGKQRGAYGEGKDMMMMVGTKKATDSVYFFSNNIFKKEQKKTDKLGRLSPSIIIDNSDKDVPILECLNGAIVFFCFFLFFSYVRESMNVHPPAASYKLRLGDILG